MRLRLFVGIRFQVSFTPLSGVLFTFPSRYWFTIGHQGVFRLGGWSPHVQTGFHVSRLTHGSTQTLRIRGCHPLRPDFPVRSACPMSTTGLLRFRSPLLTESRLMSVPPGTEMFQFPGFASRHYGFMSRYPNGVGCPIRISTDQRLLAAPRGLSQRATSFIASWCQGIHRMPFSCSTHLPRLTPGKPATGITPTAGPPCTETILSRHARHRASLSATARQTPHRDSFPHTDHSLSTQQHTPLNATPWQQDSPFPDRNRPPGQTRRHGTPRSAPEPDSP
jgi:hypothetical protein